MSFFRSFAQVLKTGTSGEAPSTAKKPTVAVAPKTITSPINKVISKPNPVVSAPISRVSPVSASAAPAPTQVVNLAVLNEAKQQADEIRRQAETRARDIVIEARSEVLKIREQMDREGREFETNLDKQQQALDRQLSSLDNRLDQVEKREEQLDKRFVALDKQKEELDEYRKKLIAALAKASHLTQDQAKEELLEKLEREVDQQASMMIQKKFATAEEEVDAKSKDLLVDAMKHGATDYVVEYTISTVPLSNPEMKGRIIGKDGRNIRAFERATGVDIEMDEGEEVRLTSFDPLRREVARRTLIQLLKDGRIQPSRIEELVEREQQELKKSMFESGKQLAHQFGIYDFPTEIIEALGRFKYRFSYGQNMTHHMIEVTQIGKKLAQELGLDVRTVVMGCLLHDIGKVLEGEGSHVQLGVVFLKRFHIPQEIIDCVAQHHEDEPFTSNESVIVHIADAVSGARPGARSENREQYVERLNEMEDIALQYPEVTRAFAIQAGRELRVILNPDKSSDRDLTVIAEKVAKQIQGEMQYPGTVTVNVIREVRAMAKAE